MVYEARRLLKDWVETQVTWNSARSGVAWGTAGISQVGVDILGTADGTGSVGWDPGILEIDVTSGVKAMAAGSANNGWRLMYVSGNGVNSKHFASREDPNPALRPALEIVYDTGMPNVAPMVSVTEPTNNTGYTAGANITLRANAVDSDGAINKVEFYNGGTLLGTSTSAPYSYNWNNVAAGTYSITAKAYDNTTATTISAMVTILVIQPTQYQYDEMGRLIRVTP